MSYRCGLDKDIEKVDKKLRELASKCLFRNVPGDPGFSYYYCEEEMYLLRNNMTGALCIVSGNSPSKAVRNLTMREVENDG